jgi:hypothetical protein
MGQLRVLPRRAGSSRLGIVAIFSGTAGLGDWRAKQRAQQDLAREEAENIRLTGSAC